MVRLSSSPRCSNRARLLGVSTHVVQVADLVAATGQRVRIITPQSFLPRVSRVLLFPGRVLRRVGSEHAVRPQPLRAPAVSAACLAARAPREVPTLIYAQDPRSAHAALMARDRSRVPIVMVVHYNQSQAEELVERGLIARDGRTDRAIRAFEAEGPFPPGRPGVRIGVHARSRARGASAASQDSLVHRAELRSCGR
jgi:hypothetical protein